MAPRYYTCLRWIIEKAKNDAFQVVLKSAKKDDANLAREIHHHRQFLHPHIARLYEVIITENLVWLVLEYCPGTGELIQDDVTLLNSVQAMNYTTIFSAMGQYRKTRPRKSSLSSLELCLMYMVCLVFIET